MYGSGLCYLLSQYFNHGAMAMEKWKRSQVLSHGKSWFGLDPSKQLPGRLKNSKVHVIVIFSTFLLNPSSIFYIEINYI